MLKKIREHIDYIRDALTWYDTLIEIHWEQHFEIKELRHEVWQLQRLLEEQGR